MKNLCPGQFFGETHGTLNHLQTPGLESAKILAGDPKKQVGLRSNFKI